MINSLKYLPFKFKDGPLKPESMGPDYRLTRKCRFVFEGSTYEFSSPRNAAYSRHSDSIHTGLTDLENHTFRDITFDYKTNWKYLQCFARRWCYWGPWFTGPQVQLSLNITLNRKDKPLPPDLSLYNPKFFEGCLVEMLEESNGHDMDMDGNASYRAPTNWKTHNHLGLPAASFWIEPVGRGLDAAPMQIFAIPASRTTMAWFAFGYQFHKPGDLKRRLELVDISQPKALAEEIFQSLKITLSPKAQADLDKAKAECPGAKLTETFAPLKWPVNSEDLNLNTNEHAISQTQ